ncbi:RHS repeat domain-containing protein [Acinetobacter sp. UC24323]|uniref:RHS repeat domain-containing protein n=1 Tax=Acinetobacter TaxID=469 RepID=UPI00209D6585|nr:RHS repeat-associated core domain-containing protein [Acinetobacter sp. UC24323]MDC4466238.1 RHS repeat-associated core domain-containing protein [Acinetobacter baumannii]MDC5596911.1 RHS repeat-associated core domain-containing protein [Acinetobacter baumannii]
MKNNDMYSKKIWSSAIQLVLLSLILLLSQLTLAKDRIQYHIQNFDGSTLKVINEQGIVSQSYQYAPFGQQLQLKKPSNLKNPQAFVGGVQDANDLVYLKQRHYNPVLGRFYQPDPVTFISGGHGQINRYHYGVNDPFTYSDKNGLEFSIINDNYFIQNHEKNFVDFTNFSAGVGDTLFLGVPVYLRNTWDIGNIDQNSSAYSFGEYVGIGLSFYSGGAAGWKAAGTKASGLEFSHWIPNRFVNAKQIENRITFLDNDFGKWLSKSGNKWNGNYVSKESHALSDPYRYRTMPRSFKDLNPPQSILFQQYNRIPLVYKGSIVGGAYGIAGANLND